MTPTFLIDKVKQKLGNKCHIMKAKNNKKLKAK